MDNHQAAPPLQIRSSSAQIQGARPRQEDALILRRDFNDVLAFVADGLGGHPRGDEASSFAVSSVIDHLFPKLESDELTDPVQSLTDSFIQAHKAVSTVSGGRFSSPASTLIGGLFRPDQAQAYLANLGDSLALRLRDNELQWLFQPQGVGSWVSYALGYDIGINGSAIESRTVDLRSGDRFLLASDGLLTLETKTIRASLNMESPRTCCEALILEVIACVAAAQDNCSVLCLFVENRDAA